MSIIRTLALDIGNKRIGVAITDALGLTAQPLLTIHRTTLKADLKSIARLIRRHEITTILIGLPTHLEGEASTQTQKTEHFAQALREHIPDTPIHLVDERLTTKHAHQLLDATQGKRKSVADRQQRTGIIDQVAATLILQSWLTTQNPPLLPDPDEES